MEYEVSDSLMGYQVYKIVSLPFTIEAKITAEFDSVIVNNYYTSTKPNNCDYSEFNVDKLHVCTVDSNFG